MKQEKKSKVLKILHTDGLGWKKIKFPVKYSILCDCLASCSACIQLNEDGVCLVTCVKVYDNVCIRDLIYSMWDTMHQKITLAL